MHPLDSTFRTFLLRLDPRLYAVLEKCAQDELRSVNAQIEYLLKEAARRAGRWKKEEGRVKSYAFVCYLIAPPRPS
ncbi:hypothetical protein CSW30_00305 [Thermus scotoductus]|uniref:Toxin-antitoxin system HicB family antitoxin n=1 Tax=Thermus scotoductus TaxID=37636 RepID=A0A430UVD3_THESC|nr:hypothetical protein [Thermus scotoductus]RTI13030.1 hypothetical protein CSW30_00305 [Thermus scotoductus]